jgi:hypothetical protein
MVLFRRMPALARLGRVIAMLAVVLALTACGPVGSSSSGPPSVRCMDEPGRGSSGEQRPLFFLFCAQSP